MVWREEEILASELLSQGGPQGSKFFILSRGQQREPSAGTHAPAGVPILGHAQGVSELSDEPCG